MRRRDDYSFGGVHSLVLSVTVSCFAETFRRVRRACSLALAGATFEPAHAQVPLVLPLDDDRTLGDSDGARRRFAGGAVLPLASQE